MALIVENSSSVPEANSYISIQYADEYFETRHNEEWDRAATEQKESALISATEYIDTTYAFKGIKATSDQGLQWPRIYATDAQGDYITGVPTVIKKGTAELALRALSEDLLEDADFFGRVKRERVDGAVEIEYAGDGVIQERSYPFIDRLFTVAGIVKHKLGISGQLKIIRV